MISFEHGAEGFERFLDNDSRQFDNFLRRKVFKDSSMTMIENWMISFEHGGSCVLSFERFLDDDGRQFDDFL